MVWASRYQYDDPAAALATMTAKTNGHLERERCTGTVRAYVAQETLLNSMSFWVGGSVRLLAQTRAAAADSIPNVARG